MKKDRNFSKQIKKIVFKITNNKRLNLEKINFSEYFDSLQMLDFVEELEKFFKIRVSEQDLNYRNFSTLKNLKKVIKKNEKNKR